jgi:hypothetical protein
MTPVARIHMLCLFALALLPWALPATAGLPPENSCPTLTPGGEDGLRIDAAPVLVHEGMIVDVQSLLRLRQPLPREVWSHRGQFFYEGMSMEIGPCHRRYPPAAFFAAASERFAGEARLDDAGNLLDYTAGVPFPQERIDPAAEDAGIRWAWNTTYRYRGAGPVGEFRIVDMPSRFGSIQTYRGSFFFIQTAHRADRSRSDYRVAVAKKKLFVAGGRFDEPFSARHLAWTQHRSVAADENYRKSDDTFVYVPTMRKIRRAATNWTDGMFTPSYRVADASGGGGIPVGGDAYVPGGGVPGGGVHPTSYKSAAQSESVRRGFTDMTLRPNAYVWRMIGERSVLAPLNSDRGGYPDDPNRNFGPSGLSVASDRWDVRYAAVIEGVTRELGREAHRITLYVDYQTLQPLYLITRFQSGRLIEIAIPVHRYSGDVRDYPEWPGGQGAMAFDPVAAVAFTALDGSGWRRESYGIRSVPVSDASLERFTSNAYLTKGK